MNYLNLNDEHIYSRTVVKRGTYSVTSLPTG